MTSLSFRFVLYLLCDTISGPAGTFSPGSTGTTFDAVFAEVIATPTQVPVWWWGIMAISSGINREAIAHIGCPPDLSGFQMEIARTRRFQKLRLHRKTPEGLNIWTYTVVGDRRTRELKGMLLEDPEKALGPGITLPPPNPHVVLAQGKKG